MAKELITTCFIVLVVVRLGRRFLVVHEAKHGQLWYLPAGRVMVGESLVQAAHRETLEEAGVPIEVEGILRFEHTPSSHNVTRFRAILLARPADDTPPKQVPDSDSLEARFVTLEELEQLPLRGEEVRRIFTYAASGPPIYPLSLLTPEGAPFS